MTPSPPAKPAEPILVAQELACRRGERLLFQRLNLQVSAGQIVWVRGNNGCGKTSLLRLLAGLAAPEHGNVAWRGVPVRKARAAYGASLVYLAHANSLKDDLTAGEALAFLAQLHGQPADLQSVGAALQGLGLYSRRNAAVRTLSQGQRRRVALARLLMAPAKPLWILDEPFDALDAEGAAQVQELLALHAASGGSVVLTSHLPLALQHPVPILLALEAYAAP